MRYDVDLIKSQLNSDNIISIMDSFDCPVVKANQNELIFPSICHHYDDFLNHKPKLYYYISTQRFKCYSCSGTWDIFGLIQHIQSVDFKTAIEFVCRICNIELADIGNNIIDDWRSMRRFLPNEDYESEEPIKIYDSSILDCFDKLYPQSWLDEGITKQAMDKFNIGWYARKQAITIPFFARNGDLIGIRARYTQDYDIQRGKYRPLSTLNETYKFPTGQALYGLYENQDAIKSCGSAYVFEAEKSVLQMHSMGVYNAVAICGHNISYSQIMQLVNIGVTTVTICFDADYHAIGDDEWNIYRSIVAKTIQKLRPYFSDIYVVYDKHGLLGYKDSPSDRGTDIWNKLYQEKLKI